MEIMDLAAKIQSLNIVKMQPTLAAVLDKAHTNENFSPRVTRSKSISPKTETSLPSASRKRKRSGEENDVEKFYLNKKITLHHKSLETIYEDPIVKKGNMLFIGTSKVKRSLFLDREFRTTSKGKSKIRKMKIKRLGMQAKKGKKISDEEFIKKLNSIECIENVEEENGNVEDNRNIVDKNRNEMKEVKDENVHEAVDKFFEEEENICDEKIQEEENICDEKIQEEESICDEKIQEEDIIEEKIHEESEGNIEDEEESMINKKILEEKEEILVDENL